jgi:hypothetical protein
MRNETNELVNVLFFTGVLTIVLILTSILNGCQNNVDSKYHKENEKNGVIVNHLREEIKHGLNHIIFNDTTEILIYRGVESCTMIQLK